MSRAGHHHITLLLALFLQPSLFHIFVLRFVSIFCILFPMHWIINKQEFNPCTRRLSVSWVSVWFVWILIFLILKGVNNESRSCALLSIGFRWKLFTWNVSVLYCCGVSVVNLCSHQLMITLIFEIHMHRALSSEGCFRQLILFLTCNYKNLKLEHLLQIRAVFQLGLISDSYHAKKLLGFYSGLDIMKQIFCTLTQLLSSLWTLFYLKRILNGQKRYFLKLT